MKRTSPILVLAAAALFLTSCINDNGTGTGVTEASSGAVVYLADQSTVGVFELFLTSSGVKLTPTMVPGGNVISFALTPDKTSVVYIADQTTDEVFELYQVNIATPGVSVKLNQTLTPGGDVQSFAITPDGTSVVYLADQRIDQVFELFRVLFSNPASSPLLNTPLINGQAVKQFAVTPDSTRVVYIANQDKLNLTVDELYQVAFLNPPSDNTKLNSTLAPGGNVKDFAISPNSVSVVYLADQTTAGVFQIYLAQVLVAGSGSVTPLNGILVPGGNVTDFAITPNSAAVIYRADETNDTVFELFQVAFVTPRQSVKLNGLLTTGGNVSASFAIAANGSAVVYSADQNILGVVELFRVALSQPPGPAQKINPNYAAPQSVSAFAITPDSSAALYLANQSGTNSGATTNAAGYAVGATVITLALAGTGTILGGDVITFTGDINQYAVLSGDNNVADGGTITLAQPGLRQAIPASATTITTVKTITQLYRVPFSCLQVNPDPSCPQAVPPPTNLPPLNGAFNGALAVGGKVRSFSVTPNSTLVLYLADQITFGVVELFAVNVGSPGASSKLNGQLVPGGNVTAFTF